MNEQVLYWVWLSLRPRLGAKGLRTLLETFGSPEALYEADGAALQRAGIAPGLRDGLLDKNPAPARTILRPFSLPPFRFPLRTAK